MVQLLSDHLGSSTEDILFISVGCACLLDRKYDPKTRCMSGTTPESALDATGGYFYQQWPPFLAELTETRPGASVDLILVDPKIEEQPLGFTQANGWECIKGPVPCFKKGCVKVSCYRMVLRWPLTKFSNRVACPRKTLRVSAAPALVAAAQKVQEWWSS